MEKSQTELVSKESELVNLRRNVSMKSRQISDLEESLQRTKEQLISKTDAGHTFTEPVLNLN